MLVGMTKFSLNERKICEATLGASADLRHKDSCMTKGLARGLSHMYCYTLRVELFSPISAQQINFDFCKTTPSNVKPQIKDASNLTRHTI